MTATRGPNRSSKLLSTQTLVKEIAERMFFPEETVQAIVDVTVSVITEALLGNNKVAIQGLGTFRPSRTGLVKFRSSVSLRQILKENLMEKYGVKMNNEALLLAKVTGECPTCKSVLDSKDPPHCPNCGTAPFEKIDPRTSMVASFGTIYGKKPDEEI